ncbi:MAG: Crp/Fnr family transcriptional regulator [Burkholderiaceae bacterium]
MRAATPRLYFVVTGQVQLAFTSARGDEKVVEIVTAGRALAKRSCSCRVHHPVAAQTLSDTLVLFVGRDAVVDELRRDTDFASRVISGLCRRIHSLVADLEDNSMRTGAQRLIGFFLRDCDDTENQDSLDVHLPVSKGVVASRLNVTQEHLS